MELKRAPEQQAHLKNPRGKSWASFFYGPNAGLAQQLANDVAKALGPHTEIIHWGKTQWAENAPDLGSLLASPSLFGDKQCYILSDAADSWAATLTNLANQAPFEHYLVVLGGDLPKSSKLRAWAEKQLGVASLPCYEEKPQNFLQRVIDQAKSLGLQMPRDAASIVANNLDGNIAAITPTLQKLALYVHPHTSITTADAVACVANQTLHALDDLVAATFNRDRHVLVQQFPRFWESGESAVGILRACQYYAGKLLQTQQHMQSGLSAQAAIDKLKPKLFYQHVDRFHAQLNLWPLPKLLAFIEKLQQAEFACKQTGAADMLVAERTLISG